MKKIARYGFMIILVCCSKAVFAFDDNVYRKERIARAIKACSSPTISIARAKSNLWEITYSNGIKQVVKFCNDGFVKDISADSSDDDWYGDWQETASGVTFSFGGFEDENGSFVTSSIMTGVSTFYNDTLEWTAKAINE